MLDPISKLLAKFVKIFSATRRIFNSPVNVWKRGPTRSFVFDVFDVFDVKSDTKFYFLQTRAVHTTVSSYRTERNSQMRHAQWSWNAEMDSSTISSAQAPLLCLIRVSIRCWGSNVFQANAVKWTGHVKWARFLHSWSQQGWYWRFLARLIVPQPVPYEEAPQRVSNLWTWSDLAAQCFRIRLSSERLCITRCQAT